MIIILSNSVENIPSWKAVSLSDGEGIPTF
jgi:hypothetical protein